MVVLLYRSVEIIFGTPPKKHNRIFFSAAGKLWSAGTAFRSPQGPGDCEALGLPPWPGGGGERPGRDGSPPAGTHLLHAVGGPALALVLHDAPDQLVVLLQQLGHRSAPSPPAPGQSRLYLSRAGRRARVTARAGNGRFYLGRAGRGARTTAVPPLFPPRPLTPALTRCSVSWFTSAFPRNRSGTKATDMAPRRPRAKVDGNRRLSTFSPTRGRTAPPPPGGAKRAPGR